ncbi:MAG: SRPBCC family protein [Reyranellaceae bacterium]
MVAPVVATSLLIRRPANVVFEAFVDPAVTSRFWFTEGSGRLEPDAKVTWTWGMYGASSNVRVKAIEPNRRILVDWDVEDNPTEIEWTFDDRGDQTVVEVVNRGFGEGDEQVTKALDSMGGFMLMLAGAKIWLEHGIDPRFVVDKHPDARLPNWNAD